MKTYTGKNLEEAINLACTDLNVTSDHLNYEVIEEKKGLFKKTCTIGVAELADVIEFAENYVKNVCNALGLAVSIKTFYRDELIKILIETDHNSIIIGKNGITLQSLNELTKLAVSNKFKKKYRVLLDIGDYKDKKYGKVISIAKRTAREVLKTHIDVKLDPMTPDERKKVHNALSTYKDLKTESVGDGKDRAIVVKYIGSAFKNEEKPELTIEEKDTSNE